MIAADGLNAAHFGVASVVFSRLPPAARTHSIDLFARPATQKYAEMATIGDGNNAP